MFDSGLLKSKVDLPVATPAFNSPPLPKRALKATSTPLNLSRRPPSVCVIMRLRPNASGLMS